MGWVKFQRDLSTVTAGGLLHSKAEATDHSETSYIRTKLDPQSKKNSTYQSVMDLATSTAFTVTPLLNASNSHLPKRRCSVWGLQVVTEELHQEVNHFKEEKV